MDAPDPRNQDCAAAGAVLGQRLQILPPVFADHEDVLSIIAPLGNVMRNAHRNHTDRPRHKFSPIITRCNLNSGFVPD